MLSRASHQTSAISCFAFNKHILKDIITHFNSIRFCTYLRSCKLTGWLRLSLKHVKFCDIIEFSYFYLKNDSDLFHNVQSMNTCIKSAKTIRNRIVIISLYFLNTML